MRHSRIITATIAATAALIAGSQGACGSNRPATGWQVKPAVSAADEVPSYELFQSTYRPHNKRPTRDRKAIKYVIALHRRDMLTPMFMKHFIADLLAEGQRGIDKWQVVIVGVPRKLAGQLMDNTPLGHRSTLINSLPPAYALDVLHYASRATYESMAKDVTALRQR